MNPQRTIKAATIGLLTMMAMRVLHAQLPEDSSQKGTPVLAESPVTARAAQLTYTSVPMAAPYISITFDDGPHATLTPRLLDMLKQRGVKATFFVVGQNAKEYPDIIRRIVSEGHEIANHSWSHPALSRLGPDAVRGQLERTNDVIFDACGKRPLVMRPPYGATNDRLNQRINSEFGMKVILWSVDPMDWRFRSSDRVTREIVTGTQPGAIILAHDIHPSTIAAMPGTLDALLSKGYRFATVSELLAMSDDSRRPAVPAATPLPVATPAPQLAPVVQGPGIRPASSGTIIIKASRD